MNSRISLSAPRKIGTAFATAAQGALASTAVQPARAITAGTGLTGGGSLASDRTISLGAAAISSLALADTAVQPADIGTMAPLNKADEPAALAGSSDTVGMTPLLTKQSAQRWAKAVVRPEQFGAVGDGTTDDTAAIVLWAAELLSTNKAAYLSGQYRVSDTIDLRGYNGDLCGAGFGHAGFIFTDKSKPGLKIGCQTISGTGQGACYREFFVEYATAATSADTSANGIELYYFRYSKLDSVEVRYAYRGFYAPATPTDNHCFSATLSNLKAFRCAGFYFYITSGTATGNTGCVFSNWYASGNRSDVASQVCDIAIFIERMSDGVVNQMNVEWVTCNKAIAITRSSPRVNGLHLEGVAANENNGAFIRLDGSIVDIMTRVKTCNFSGGDPETAAVGTIANYGLVQLEDDAFTSMGSHVRLIGSNAGCTLATTNTRFAISNGGWDAYQSLDVPQWIDEDGIFTDATGKPKVNFVGAPTTAHMPILRVYNNLRFRPYARGHNDAGTAGAGIVLWSQQEDLYACYDPATGKFEAAVEGTYLLSFSAQTASNAEIRQESSAGVEATAKRKSFGPAGGYVTGSAAVYMAAGEKIYVYGNAATTANANTEVTFVALN